MNETGAAQTRLPDVPESWQRRHVLDVDDWSRSELQTVLDFTTHMSDILSQPRAKLSVLAGCKVVTLFYEPSTRTRVSFEMAAKTLGADVINVTAKSSSIEKGENLADTISTLQAIGAEVIIMRHPLSGAHYTLIPSQVTLINAGDGWHAHPSQALLDLYTMVKHKGDLSNKKVVIVGDVRHSRVARSNIWALSHMGAHIVVSAPPSLLPPGISPIATELFPGVEVEMDLEKALVDADVVMALRLQKERMQPGVLPSVGEFINRYQLDHRRLKAASPDVIVMHPGPANEGIEITQSVAHGPRSVITEQVTNGVAVRMALLYLLVGR